MEKENSKNSTTKASKSEAVLSVDEQLLKEEAEYFTQVTAAIRRHIVKPKKFSNVSTIKGPLHALCIQYDYDNMKIIVVGKIRRAGAKRNQDASTSLLNSGGDDNDNSANSVPTIARS